MSDARTRATEGRLMPRAVVQRIAAPASALISEPAFHQSTQGQVAKRDWPMAALGAGELALPTRIRLARHRATTRPTLTLDMDRLGRYARLITNCLHRGTS